MPDRSSVATALARLDGIDTVTSEERSRLAEARQKLADASVVVAVLGEFKRGKSTFLNALIGAPVLPTGVVPVTAVPTMLCWGERPRVVVTTAHGTEVCDVDALTNLVTENGNPGNWRGVQNVVVEYPADALGRGLTLVDTPGTGSVHRHNTETTQAFLPRVDVAIALLTADAALSEAEVALLGEVAQGAARIAVCLTKADLLTVDDRAEAERFVRSGVQQRLGRQDVPLFTVSARRALDGNADQGMTAVAAWLDAEVRAQRQSIATERAAHIAREVCCLAVAAVRLERAALERPASEATQRRAIVDRALHELETDADEVRTLLRDAARRVTAEAVDPEVASLRDSLALRLRELPDERWPDAIRDATAEWSVRVQQRSAALLTPMVERHVARLHVQVERFVATLGSAFAVDLSSPPPVDVPVHVAAPAVEDADVAGALATAVHGLRSRLPGRVGERWRRAAHLRRADEVADRLAGRVRHAATQAVFRAIGEISADADQRRQSVAAALMEAVERSEAALRGEADALHTRRVALDGTAAALQEIAESLGLGIPA